MRTGSGVMDMQSVDYYTVTTPEGVDLSHTGFCCPLCNKSLQQGKSQLMPFPYARIC
jgi:hypothetical protein